MSLNTIELLNLNWAFQFKEEEKTENKTKTEIKIKQLHFLFSDILLGLLVKLTSNLSRRCGHAIPGNFTHSAYIKLENYTTRVTILLTLPPLKWKDCTKYKYNIMLATI